MLLLSVSFGAFAQTPTAEYINAAKKETSKYETLQFKLKNVQLDEVKKQCANYTKYFEMVRSESTRDGISIELRLVSMDDMNRKVVHRLMVSLNIKEIQSGGKKYPTEAFFKKFIY